MSNKERSKRDNHDSSRQTETKDHRVDTRDTYQGEDYRSTNLRDSPMMAHLLDALEQGEDIGPYGQLTFVMVARHFMSDDEMIRLLEGQPDFEEKEARAKILQVKTRDYNPPKRERILQWMKRQRFPICPNPEDPNGCNVYRELQFPDGIYEHIDEFWEEKAGAEGEE